MWCRINYHGKSIFFGAVCRPPNFFPEYIAHHTNSRSDIILCGDFNLPWINWPDLCYDHHKVASAESLLLTAFSFSLSKLIFCATRIVDSCSSILDLVFVSSSLEDCTISVENGISDHKIIRISCPITLYRTTETVRATYFRECAYDDAILAHLEFSFSDSEKIKNVMKLWSCFKDMPRYCEAC